MAAIRKSFDEFVDGLMEMNKKEILIRLLTKSDTDEAKKDIQKEAFLFVLNDRQLDELARNHFSELVEQEYTLPLSFIKKAINFIGETDRSALGEILERYLPIMDAETLRYYLKSAIFKKIINENAHRLNQNALLGIYKELDIQNMDLLEKIYAAKECDVDGLNEKQICAFGLVKKYSEAEIEKIVARTDKMENDMARNKILSVLAAHQDCPKKRAIVEKLLKADRKSTIKNQCLDEIMPLEIKNDAEMGLLLQNRKTDRSLVKDYYLNNLALGKGSNSLPLIEMFTMNM